MKDIVKHILTNEFPQSVVEDINIIDDRVQFTIYIRKTLTIKEAQKNLYFTDIRGKGKLFKAHIKTLNDFNVFTCDYPLKQKYYNRIYSDSEYGKLQKWLLSNATTKEEFKNFLKNLIKDVAYLRNIEPDFYKKRFLSNIKIGLVKLLYKHYDVSATLQKSYSDDLLVLFSTDNLNTHLRYEVVKNTINNNYKRTNVIFQKREYDTSDYLVITEKIKLIRHNLKKLVNPELFNINIFINE